MKSFKLFKRLGALLTAVAVLASMGTVAFATETAPTIAIGDVTIAPTDVVNGEGVYTITVPYTVTGTIGDKGVTMLAYTKGSTNDSLVAGDGFTQYKSDYSIAYVTQEAPVLTEGAGSLSFKVDTTGEEAIEVGAGEKILILLGGDNVVAPASALVTTYWFAEDVVIDEFAGFGTALEVNLDNAETPESVLEEALAAYTLLVTDEAGENEAEVDWADAEIAVAETTTEENAANDGATHKATITVGTNVALEGAYITEALTETIFFSVNETWTADTITISETEYLIYGSDLDEISQATITEALTELVLAETITAGKAETALEVEVDTVANADAITVEIKEGELAGDVDASDVVFVVTLAANTVLGEGITVGEKAIATEITLDYIVEKPISWNVTGAEFEGTLAVTYDYPDGSDKVEKAKAALIGEEVKLTGANPGEVYDYEITEEVANAAVFTEENAVATITILADTYDEMAIVTEDTEVAITIEYTENASGYVASGAVLVDGADIDVTVDENTAEKIKAAIVAEGLEVKATLTRGSYVVEDVLIPVTAEMIAVTAPTITEPATEGDYTAVITVGTGVEIDVAQDVVGNLAAAIELNIGGTVTVKSYIYGDADGDGEITGLDATVVLRHVAGFSENINVDAADVDSDGEVTGLDATVILRTVAGFYQESDLPLAPM